MNKNLSNSPDSNDHSEPPFIRQLSWSDLPGCDVVISMSGSTVERAIVFLDGREEVRLVLFRESARGGLFDVIVEPGTNPDDKSLLAMGRTIVAYLAFELEWKEVR